MRRAGWWTNTHYRLRRLIARVAGYWDWLLAGIEEMTILIGLRPRYIPPPRLSKRELQVIEGRKYSRAEIAAAARLVVDPHFVPPAEMPEEREP